jgi:ABC-type glycerol-3-phosphate transport system substrate-binding protein
LGAIVRFTFIPWGDEKNQISRAIAAKEYDIYVGGAWTDFKNFAVKNAFVDLKPMLAKVPKLAEHYGDVLQRAEIDGKLYGIPQLNKPGAGGEGILYREDLRKKWGLPEVEDMDSLEKYLYKAKQEFPDTPMINDQRVGDKIFQLIAGNKYLPSITSMQGTALTVGTYDNPFKAISIYDTPEYKQAVTIAKKWYDDGIIAHDILASQGNETDKTKQLMLAGKKPLEFSNHFGAVSTAYIPALKKDHPDWEFGWLDIGFDMFPNSVRLPAVSAETATMMSIGANSKYPEIALKLIEKAHTDRTYYDLLQYGVQGVHYNKQGDSINYTGIDDKNRKPGWTGLVDGYMNYQEKYPGEWQAISDKLGTEGPKLAVKNGPSPYEGFVFNTADLSAELSSLQTARTQYVLPLQTGVVKKSVDSDLDTAKQQLKGAGLDKYMAALQKQLDAFAASKKK